jgi:DNA-directed RNA polymerase subunit alpha
VILESIESAPAVEDVQPSVQTVELTENYGHFHIEPLRRGFGHTLGTPLRRILLSSLPGAAIATARVDGVLHEFSTLDFMREDTLEFLLNVKRVRLRSFQSDGAVCYLDKTGPAEITAADIECPSGVEIANPDHYLGTLAEDGTLRAEFTVERGVGYVGAEEHSGLPIGVIPLDTVFSPVAKVEYHVEHARVGQETEFDRLVIKVWTDGTTDPQEALSGAAGQLVEMFGLIAGVGDPDTMAPATQVAAEIDVGGDPLEDLKLSNRALNCLKRHGLETVQELARMTEDDLFGLRGMGVRLVDEIRDALESRGLSLVAGEHSEETD